MNINEEQKKYISIIEGCFNENNPYIDSIDDFNDWLYENEEITSLFTIGSGLTKVVLIPKDENAHYVYKIPILGTSCASFINEETGEILKGEYIIFSDFDPDRHNDFCDIEADRCYDICKEGYGDLIAKEYYYGEISNIPIYIQEKAVIFSEIFDGDTLRTEEEITSVRDVTSSFFNFDEYFNCIPDRWIADLINVIGIEETIKFFDFLIDTNYNNDLHQGNIGYIKGKPVLVDYSGFIYQWGWEEDYED